MDMAERAAQVLKEIIVRMGYDFEVEATEQDGKIQLDIVGDEQGELIGQKGITLDALQFILGRMLGQLERCKTPVVVEDGGYRQRRNDALVELAGQVKDKALETGKIVSLNPMSAHDRRIVHMTLRDEPDVTTHSEGEGDQRCILVVPEGD